MTGAAAALEAETRRLMALHAATAARGFDTIKQRQHLHALIDQYLDRYADAQTLAALET